MTRPSALSLAIACVRADADANAMHTFCHRPRSVEGPWTTHRRRPRSRPSSIARDPRPRPCSTRKRRAKKRRPAPRSRSSSPTTCCPGVDSEPVSFHEAFAKGGALMFVVLGLLISLDQLTLNAVQTIEPEIRARRSTSAAARPCSSATASGLFYALGAIPLGWLADRVKRVPIVGIAGLLAAVFTVLTGLARQRVHVLLDGLLDRHRQGEQHRRAPAAARRQLPDRHPRPDVGVDEHRHSRSSATSARCSSALIATSRSAATKAGGGRSSCSASRARIVARRSRSSCKRAAARAVREGRRARRGRSRTRTRRSRRWRPRSRRLKKIATIRTSIAAFAALGFGVFALGSLQVLYLNDTLHVHEHPAPRLHPQHRGLDRGAVPVSGRRVLRPDVPQGSGEGAHARRPADPARRRSSRRSRSRPTAS